MREILFRAKAKNNGKWIYGYLYRISEKLNPFIMLVDKAGESREVIPSTVGQFTGLYDSTKWEELTPEEQAYFLYPANGGKHSKEEWKGNPIFEGDIVKDCYGRIEQCYYNKSRYRLMFDGTHYTRELEFANEVEYKIIGNIHDNPELLKVGDDK